MRRSAPSVAFVTLGCGRNEVDSDQLGGSLTAAGFALVDDPAAADCVIVNTCTFIGPARQESVDTILDVCDLPGEVVVVGCMAQQHTAELTEALPEVARVVGFAEYARLPAIVDEVLARADVPAVSGIADAVPLTEETGLGPSRGGAWWVGGLGPRSGTAPAVPRSTTAGKPPTGVPVAGGSSAPITGRAALPLVGAAPAVPTGPESPPTAAFPARTTPRGVWAYLKIAGGCDRVCTFCTIPSYRGRFASRPADELVAEAAWLAGAGARELVCVSENTTSWGKDLPEGRRGMVRLLDRLGAVEGLDRVRLLYLQPAEIVPEVLDAMAASPVVASYYDLSLQHAAPAVLTRMGRSGSAERFLDLITGIRARDPGAVFRSSFIVGFPGETEDDVAVLAEFIEAAGLDWAGFFSYSPEDGTPAAALDGHLPDDEVAARRDALTDVAELVAAERTRAWIGREVEVLSERVESGSTFGRSHREAPDTDGEIRLAGVAVPPGRMVRALVTDSDGVDLVAAAQPQARAAAQGPDGVRAVVGSAPRAEGRGPVGAGGR